jgi:hypothetical protein
VFLYAHQFPRGLRFPRLGGPKDQRRLYSAGSRFYIQSENPILGFATLRAQKWCIGRERFSLGTILFETPLAGWAVVFWFVEALVGWWFCCVALFASGLYRLSAEQLQVESSERGLSCSGPVPVLRSRLAAYLKAAPMDQKGEQ